MNKAYFDIETAPLPEIMLQGLEPEFTAPSTWKDPDKIKTCKAEKRAEWLATLALSPLTGSICAIGRLQQTKDGLLESIFLAEDYSEKVLIADFWKFWHEQQNHSLFIGFNILKFDLPFLVKRSWHLGVDVPIGIRNRYWNDCFVDLLELYQLGDRQSFISLNTLAKWLGVGEKTGHGADFHKLSSAEKRLYLAQDLALTKKCAEKLIL